MRKFIQPVVTTLVVALSALIAVWFIAHPLWLFPTLFGVVVLLTALGFYQEWRAR